MKTVKKIEQYVSNGNTCVALLVEDGVLCISCADNEGIFPLAIHTESGHEIDYEFDDQEELIWFKNVTIGLEAGTDSEKENDEEEDETDNVYVIPPKVLSVKPFLSMRDASISVLVETHNGEKDYLVVDAYSDFECFPIAVFTEPGHQINYRFDDEGDFIWFKNFTLNLEYKIASNKKEDDVPISKKTALPSQTNHQTRKTDWFGISLVAAVLALLAVACIMYFFTN